MIVSYLLPKLPNARMSVVFKLELHNHTNNNNSNNSNNSNDNHNSNTNQNFNHQVSGPSGFIVCSGSEGFRSPGAVGFL